MKTTFLTLIMALLVSLPVSAQNDSEQPTNNEELANRKTEMMADKLMLSQDQREEVYQATLEMLEDKRSGDKSKGEAKKEYDEEMREILNDEQYLSYREHKKKGDFEHKKGAIKKDDKKYNKTKDKRKRQGM